MASADKKLTLRILMGMGAGIACGILLNQVGHLEFVQSSLTEGALRVCGQIFVSLLKLLVVPIVLVSLTCGIASLPNLNTLGRVGGRTLALYLSTTALAVSIALGMGLLLSPGVGLELAAPADFAAKPPPGVAQTIIGFFPANPVAAMAQAKTLQLIVIACLLGITLPLCGGAGERVLALFSDLNQVILKMMMLIMQLAPLGVFCLSAKVFAEQGMGVLLSLGSYFLCVLAALVAHVLLVYCPILKLMAKLDLRHFFVKARDFALLAFSTASSGATLPVTLDTMENKMGVDKSVSSFSLPLGATIHMDGSAMMQGVATVFIAQVYGVHLGPGQMIAVVAIATLAAVGTAAVPGAGLITLTMVLRQVNLPIEGIGLIIGVDRLLDMARTSVNVLGDAAVSLWVAKAEGRLDEKTYTA